MLFIVIHRLYAFIYASNLYLTLIKNKEIKKDQWESSYCW